MVTILNDNKEKEHEASGPNQNFKILNCYFFLAVDYSWENKKKEKTIDLFPRRESNPGRGGESAES